ncbi:MAG: HD domain-containing phosphohydrolase [Lachnospiraceae bacterium]
MKNKRKKHHENNREHIQYIFTLIITLAALTVIVCYSFGSFYSIARGDAVAIGEKSVSEESEKLNNFLLKGLDVVQVTGLTIDYMLQNGSTSEEIEQYLLEESADYTAQIDESFTGIYGVFNGDYIDGIGWVPDEDYVPQERPWYTTAVEGGGDPVVVSPYLDAQTNSVMISISQLLSDGESVVSLDIVMDEIQGIAQDINLNGNGYGFIIDGNGLVVAHSDEKQKGKNYLSDEDMQGTEMQELVEQIISVKGKTIHTKLDGEACRVFSKVVQNDWYVVMIINTADLFHRVQSNLIRNIIISLFIFAVVVYFCTTSYQNRMKAMHYADELKNYQLTLEERVLEQTKEIKGQTKRMLKMQENVIEGMATLIESRDGNTGEHVRSTKKYVSMIVNYMYEHQIHLEEVDEEFVEKVTNAAALHDVGKIMISDTILNKPGRFTAEEYEIMKTHSRLGGDIVENILGKNADEHLVQISCDVAQYHHEKWDGSGYPEGLKGEEIPLCARIMAVADVFDALVSKRVYKDKIPPEEAFAIIQEESGKHFDPEIVDIFMAIRNEIEEYLKQL